VVDPARLAAERDELVARVGAAGEVGVDVATLDDRARALLPTTALLVTEGRVRSRPDRLAEHPALAALDSFSPPPPTFDPVELRQLVQRGLVVQQDGISFAATAVERAADVVAGLLAASPEGFTVAEVRQALGTTRKYALPLLAVLDARGLTVRRGEVRVAR
jgi:selenocysteine-specific elongation factor